MSIKSIAPASKRIMGGDCSTQSFAFSIFDDGKLVQWGEVKFVGKTVFERLADGQRKITALRDNMQVDRVVIESAIFVQNKKTVILLAYAYGAIISALVNNGAVVDEVIPTTWQRAISNPPLTRKEKDSIMKGNPGKSASWYSAKYREFRKHRTQQWVKDTFGLEIQSDNITDAIGIGWYGVNV